MRDKYKTLIKKIALPLGGLALLASASGCILDESRRYYFPINFSSYYKISKDKKYMNIEEYNGGDGEGGASSGSGSSGASGGAGTGGAGGK